MQQQPFERGKYYHIFNRGNNKENIFKAIENYDYFTRLMKKYLTDYIDIYAYCLLPNHFHILCKFKTQAEISGKKELKPHIPLSNMFNAYTKAINKRFDRTGSLFQEHLHRINITDDEYFLNLITYIHTNPEKHNIVSNFEKYKYSSYKAYITGKESLLKREYVKELFDDSENFIYCHRQKKIKLDLLKEITELDY
ncbi:MAG: transposase [Chlorobi bacterium]|nr:transposase [Chlorobiota bacterium]